MQLRLFEDDADAGSLEGLAASQLLGQLVIVHAGNPDDGCCGVWIGAPTPSESNSGIEWAWIEPLWVVGRPTSATESLDTPDHLRHTELPEPDLDIRMADDLDSGAADAS